MIVSASRRTDIPAFFGKWFLQRMKEGFVFVRNPVNASYVRRVDLSPSLIECIVFWTKNPAPFVSMLDELDSYNVPYYFLFTITPYGPDIERHLPEKAEVIETFRALSKRLGKKRVIWRYDPILITQSIDAAYHLNQFEKLSCRLEGFTEKCIVSFLTMYKRCRRNLKDIDIETLNDDEKIELAQALNTSAQKHDMELSVCAEQVDFPAAGISRARCIDSDLVSRLCGKHIPYAKDRGQRKTCMCTVSADIGTYDTCSHGCLYCYANLNVAEVNLNAPPNPGH